MSQDSHDVSNVGDAVCGFGNRSLGLSDTGWEGSSPMGSRERRALPG